MSTPKANLKLAAIELICRRFDTGQREQSHKEIRMHTGRRRRAFTTIELVVAISILIVLIGIVVVAMRAVVGGSKEKATHVTLDNLRGMLTELELKGGLSRQPGSMWVNNTEVKSPPVALDFWHDGDPTKNAVPQPDPVVAPSGTVRRGEAGRYDNDLVANTAIAFNMIASIPANRTAIGQLPSNQLDSIPSTGMPNHLLAFQPQPLILDGWGNPIIFVPAGGLEVRFESRKDSSGNVPMLVVTSGGVYDRTAAPPAIPAGIRPFFASAGPDGIFGWTDVNGNGTFDAGDIAGGDDNLYSFEQ
jgi:type II secretory pathway pseudopilin PulG